MSSVIDRQKEFIPQWDGNRERPEDSQIKAVLRVPSFADLRSLPNPSVAVVTVLTVMNSRSVDGQTILLTDLSRLTRGVLSSAAWAKEAGIDQAAVPDADTLLKNVLEFCEVYVRRLVPQISGLDGIATGAELVDGPSAQAGLVLELALELWISHSLGSAKKKD